MAFLFVTSPKWVRIGFDPGHDPLFSISQWLRSCQNHLPVFSNQPRIRIQTVEAKTPAFCLTLLPTTIGMALQILTFPKWVRNGFGPGARSFVFNKSIDRKS